MISSTRSPARSSAFTIVELLVALLLVAVVGAGSIWAFFSRSEVTLDNAARLLIDDLQVARDRAAIERLPIELVFSTDGSGYQFFEQAPEALETSTRPKLQVRSYSDNAVFQGVRICAVDCGSRRTLRFDTNGAAVEAARITLGYAGEALTIIVEQGRRAIYVPGSSIRGSSGGE